MEKAAERACPVVGEKIATPVVVPRAEQGTVRVVDKVEGRIGRNENCSEILTEIPG